MRFLLIVLSLSLGNKIYSQQFDKLYFGNWINSELKSKFQSGQSRDSSLYVIPRHMYIDNFKTIRISLRFEQRAIPYKVKKVGSNVIWIELGKLNLKVDTILLEDRYFGEIKLVRNIPVN